MNHSRVFIAIIVALSFANCSPYFAESSRSRSEKADAIFTVIADGGEKVGYISAVSSRWMLFLEDVGSGQGNSIRIPSMLRVQSISLARGGEYLLLNRGTETEIFPTSEASGEVAKVEAAPDCVVVDSVFNPSAKVLGMLCSDELSRETHLYVYEWEGRGEVLFRFQARIEGIGQKILLSPDGSRVGAIVSRRVSVFESGKGLNIAGFDADSAVGTAAAFLHERFVVGGGLSGKVYGYDISGEGRRLVGQVDGVLRHLEPFTHQGMPHVLAVSDSGSAFVYRLMESSDWRKASLKLKKVRKV